MSHLYFAKSFNHHAYPARIALNFNHDPANNGTDKAYRFQPEYADWPYLPYRNSTYTVRKIEEMKIAFKEDGIEDYDIQKHGDHVELRFRNDHDLILASAYLFPDADLEFEFMPCPDYFSNFDLKRQTKEVQKFYDTVDMDQAKLTQPVKLKADFEERSIRAYAAAADVATVMRHAKQFAIVFAAS